MPIAQRKLHSQQIAADGLARTDSAEPRSAPALHVKYSPVAHQVAVPHLIPRPGAAGTSAPHCAASGPADIAASDRRIIGSTWNTPQSRNRRRRLGPSSMRRWTSGSMICTGRQRRQLGQGGGLFAIHLRANPVVASPQRPWAPAASQCSTSPNTTNRSVPRRIRCSSRRVRNDRPRPRT